MRILPARTSEIAGWLFALALSFCSPFSPIIPRSLSEKILQPLGNNSSNLIGTVDPTADTRSDPRIESCRSCSWSPPSGFRDPLFRIGRRGGGPRRPGLRHPACLLCHRRYQDLRHFGAQAVFWEHSRHNPMSSRWPSLIISPCPIIARYSTIFQSSDCRKIGCNRIGSGKNGRIFPRQLPGGSEKAEASPWADRPPFPHRSSGRQGRRPLRKAEEGRADLFDFASRVSGKFQLPPLTLLDHVERKDTRIKRKPIAFRFSRKLDFGVGGGGGGKPGPVTHV